MAKTLLFPSSLFWQLWSSVWLKGPAQRKLSNTGKVSENAQKRTPPTWWNGTPWSTQKRTPLIQGGLGAGHCFSFGGQAEVGFRVWDKGTFSAAFFQQPFSAAFLGSLGGWDKGTFSAAFLGSKRAFLSGLSLLSSCCVHGLVVSWAVFPPLSSCCVQGLAVSWSVFPQLSSCCGQGLVVSYYHFPVVRGWWSASNVILLWSGVGGQKLTSSYCGQGLVVNYEHVLRKNPFARLSGKSQYRLIYRK